MSYIMQMPVEEFVEFIQLAMEKEAKEGYKAEWNTLLPYMSMKNLKWMPFNEYYNRVTGKNIDRRPASVIIAEIEEAHRLQSMEGGQ